MPTDHQPSIPQVLEQVVVVLGELEVVFGTSARPALAAVRARLTDAMAARDRGDPVASLQAIGEAMHQLAALAQHLDPNEAMLMRAVAERFGAALLRGNEAEAKQDMDLMFQRSGARERKPS